MRTQWNLIAKYLSQECTGEESRIIEERIHTDEHFAKLIKALQLSTDLREEPSRPIAVDKLWQEFLQRTADGKKQATVKKFVQSKPQTPGWHARRTNPYLRIAAMLLLALSISYWVSDGYKFFSNQSELASQYETVKVSNGERINLSLTDGSLVTVDAGSELRYFTSYQNERHVYLKGEASFDIAHDNERPFYVHAGNAVVRVVGTRFNVRSWDINPHVVVTVAEGKVRVSPIDFPESNSKLLKKGEQSGVSAEGELSEIIEVDVDRYFRWMQNEIYFENAKVKEVVAQMERWYNLQFEFADPRSLEQEITVHIRWANINEVNNVISLVTNTDFVREGKDIRFLQKK